MPTRSFPRWLRIVADMDELSQVAAAAVAQAIHESVAATGKCRLALAGGLTPRQLYQLLATRYHRELPWNQVHCFFGDERYVPADDPRSNYRMAKETLLDKVHLPRNHVHPMPTAEADYRHAAAQYESTLREHFGDDPWPRFDLVLLGLGEDGHTASLFPHSTVLEERVHWVAPALAPAEPQRRLTLTYPVFNHAARVYFLVSGGGKARALKLALRDDAHYEMAPAAAIRPPEGELVWWVDEAAAMEIRYPKDAPQ